MTTRPGVANSRAQVWVSAVASIFVLVPALLIGNILPWFSHWHGWPVTYMVREVRVPGGLSIFYGPWPLYDPPLVKFRAWALAVNIVAGVGLIVAATASAVYLLRNLNRQLQFSLGKLFLGVTLVVIFLGLTPIVVRLLPASAAAWVNWWLVIPVSRLTLNAATFCVIVVGAHFFAFRASEWARASRWFHLHAVTWITAFIACGPFLHHALFGRTTFVPSGRENTPGSISLDGHGWPVDYFGYYRGSASARLSLQAEGFVTEYFEPLPLLTNIVAATIVIAAVLFCVERWVRRTERREVVRVRSIATIILVIGGTIAVCLLDPALPPC